MSVTNIKEREYSLTVKNLLKIPGHIIRGIKYHAAGHIYTPKPISTTLIVTNRCNSRCLMCTYWKSPYNKRELSILEIGKIFQNPLFSSIKDFTISGGEPTLRKDLTEIVRVVLERCPKIERVTLCTNGLDPDLVVKKINEIMQLPQVGALNEFVVSISLDGCGEIHERIRRVPHAFEKVIETIMRLKRLRQTGSFNIYLTCVVQPLNVDNIVQLWKYVQELKLTIAFVPINLALTSLKSCREDAINGNSLRLTDNHLKQLKETFCHELKPVLPLSMVIFWEQYFKIVEGSKRMLPCFLKYKHAGIDSDGNLIICETSSKIPLILASLRDGNINEIWFSEATRAKRDRLEKDVCINCDVPCDIAFSLREEFFFAARFLLKEKVRKLMGK